MRVHSLVDLDVSTQFEPEQSKEVSAKQTIISLF